jgi:hypothetical protein
MFVGGGNWGSFDNPKSIAAMRYCVTGGTRIRTEHGLVRIKDIPGLYGYDASFLTTPGASFDLDLGVTSLRNTKQTASKWINSGQHKVLRIKTNTDIDIVCTPNHPLLVLNSSFEYEWKCAGDLALGDCLAMNRADVNTLPKSSPISTEMAITLGYCVSEGYLTKNFLYINSAYKGQNDDFRSNFNSALPNAPLIERVCKPSGYGKRKFRSFECNSVATVAKFADLGLYPGNSYSRRVPKVLFSCAKNEVAAFLQGYFEGDGSISIVNGSVLITAHSVSLKLLKEVKLLLWEYFGILTTRVSRERKGGAGHRFFISGVDSIRTFLTEIGFRTARKQVVCDAAIKLCENITVYGGLSKVDVIPHCSTADFKVHKTVRKFRENFHKMPETDRQTMQDVYSANYFHAKVEKIESGGKSYLANKIAKSLGITNIKMDAIRDEMVKDPVLEPWVNFFWHKNEAEYYPTTHPEEQWQNIVNQSEAFWPTMKRKIEETLASGKPAIFEGVNLLPHLMRELSIKGVVILGNSEEETFERIKADPRWGKSEELQRLKADAFFNVERPRYEAEAKKYGYPTFDGPEDAEAELIRLIQQTS